jgi:hypothetical protein
MIHFVPRSKHLLCLLHKGSLYFGVAKYLLRMGISQTATYLPGHRGLEPCHTLTPELNPQPPANLVAVRLYKGLTA